MALKENIMRILVFASCALMTSGWLLTSTHPATAAPQTWQYQHCVSQCQSDAYICKQKDTECTSFKHTSGSSHRVCTHKVKLPCAKNMVKCKAGCLSPEPKTTQPATSPPPQKGIFPSKGKCKYAGEPGCN